MQEASDSVVVCWLLSPGMSSLSPANDYGVVAGAEGLPVAGTRAGAVTGESAAAPTRAALPTPDAVTDEGSDYRKEDKRAECVDMPHKEHQAEDHVPDEKVDDQAADADTTESQVRSR